MRLVRAALCDDEPLALDRLASLLERSGGVEVVGAFGSGEALLKAVGDLSPDLVFLDVNMPRMDGFDVVEAMTRTEWPNGVAPPLVIFITAHSSYAVAAFDSGALDFISKPVRLTRLDQALERARKAIDDVEASTRFRELQSQLEELKRLYGEHRQSRHLWVKRSGSTIRVPVSSIRWISAEGEYVRLHCLDDDLLERTSLSEMADALRPFGFIRIHRSTLVNTNEVERVEMGRWGRSFVRLAGGAQLAVGRTYRSALQDVQRSDLRANP
jgi:DNA-binding LytR/AlgR family response regulator